ncbi:CPBP family intramembrane glutamic endopeptidase [Halorientalis salina]|uniref:CPBP family intramembrane glutamic endopeptidase n=1 Tax=Halorientalis salina TaxID=2932266 RepID=UPI0010AC2A3D|nr:type II CAAX endopeptidase family protein [Halorientalis salina]
MSADESPETDDVASRDGGAGTLRRVFWNTTEHRLRMPWRLAGGLTAFLVVTLAVGLFTSLLPTAGGLDGPYLPALYGTVLYLAITTALLVALVGISYVVDRREFTDLGLGFDRQWWRDCAFGLALGVVLPTAVFLVQLAAGWVTVTGVLVTSRGSLLPFGTAPAWFALVLVGFFFVGVSVFEELVVRGYLLTNIAEGLAGFWRVGVRGAIWIATLVTAAVFGVLHASNPNATPLSVLNITLFGVLLGLGFVWTDRLGVPIGMHLTWNATVGGVYGFPVSGITLGVAVFETETTGPELVTGGAFGPEGGLVALLALVLGLALLWWWVRRAYGTVSLREGVAVPTLRENRTR